MQFSQFPHTFYRFSRRFFSVFVFFCLLMTAGASFADEEEEGSFWAGLDKLSIEEPTDRLAIHSALGGRDDYLMVYGGARARLSRRFNLVGTLVAPLFEDAEDPNYFGLHFAAQEDLIVRANGRVYVSADYTVHMPAASKASAWDGETVNELGFGFGISQGMGFINRVRLFYEGTWNVTGKGTWRRSGPDGTQTGEQTDDFTGYQFVFGGEIIF